ncbi:hypothetical protein [Enterococcus sp. CSURQ0835]|uniref:hypothetical protein n=1 Tax=Enterococcus sp. CSURQ0835 TaxID=2681394 RepID=UPI00135B1DEF|nr:hypothetical protein [Enterococcus sp. CSURQ0835]
MQVKYVFHDPVSGRKKKGVQMRLTDRIPQKGELISLKRNNHERLFEVMEVEKSEVGYGEQKKILLLVRVKMAE